MATAVQNLEAARDGAAAKLAEALSGDYSKAIEFKPNFNSTNGADRVSYLRELRETIKDLNAQLSLMDPFEVTTEMTA